MINTKEIHALAKAAGGCSEGVQAILDRGAPEELIKLYKEKIDFCLSENFPSNEYLEASIESELLIKNGIFLNKSVKLQNADFVVLLGDCDLDMKVNEYSVSQIYIKHASEAKLAIEDNAFVVIDCFDNSQLVVDAFGASKVRINVYGNAEVKANEFDSAVVKIDKKNRESY